MIKIKEESTIYEVSKFIANSKLDNAKLVLAIIESKSNIYGEEDFLAWDKEVKFWERFIDECKNQRLLD